MQIVKISTLFILALSLNGCNRSQNNGIVVEETYVHRYGVEVPPEDFAATGQSGKIITTLKNGVVVSKSVSCGILEGDTTYSFPHSEVIQKVETYAHGTIQKMMVHYYSGNPCREIIFTGPDSRLITKWYENGSPQSSEEIVNNRLINGEYFTQNNQMETNVVSGSGLRTQRDTYGLHISTDTIENGEMVQCSTFYPNGAPKDIMPYKNGVVEGELKTFFPGGEPNSIEMWVGGKKEGITFVYQNGEKYAEVPFVCGVKHGVEKRFRDGEHVIEEITWINDERHGPSYSYVGEAVRTDWYYQNRLVTEKTFDLLDRGKTR